MKKTMLTFIPVVLLLVIGILYFSENISFNNKNEASIISNEHVEEIFNLSNNSVYYLIIDDFGCQSCFYKTINFINQNKIEGLFIITSELQLSILKPIAKKNNYGITSFPSNDYLAILSKNGTPFLIKKEESGPHFYVNNQPTKIIELLKVAFKGSY